MNGERKGTHGYMSRVLKVIKSSKCIWKRQEIKDKKGTNICEIKYALPSLPPNPILE